MTIHLIPILKDNYAFLIEGPGKTCAVFDPGEAMPIIEYIETRNLKLTHVLITHHHWDHTDGNLDIKKHFDCDIYGPQAESNKIPGLDHELQERESFSLFGHDVKLFQCRGHTQGHLVYYIPDLKAVFVGDVLFSMGCGRLFEGTAAEAWEDFQKILSLPDDTMMYCSHEYTQVNAKFCLSIEPDNADLQARYEEVKLLRKSRQPTIPVSLDVEKKTNAFIRAGSAERFAEIRALRDKL